MRQYIKSGGIHFRNFVVFVYKHFMDDNCRQHAIVLTYTTLFAVVPIMTVTFTLLSAIPSLHHVSADIQGFVFRHFIPSTGMMVQHRLQEFSHQAGQLTLVGAGMLLVTALLMLLTIEKSFNHIWRVRHERKGIVSFLRYWAVLSLGPLLLGAGFAISSYITSQELFASAASMVRHFIPGMRLVTFMFTALAFTLLYIAVPNCKVPFKAAFAGGLFAAVLFELAKRAFGIFVMNFSSYKLVYGAFAALPVFLIWVYLSWSIILLGVEVSRALAIYRDDSKAFRHPVLALLDVLQLFWQRQQRGLTVSDIDAMAVLGKDEIEVWFDFSRILQEQRIIHRTDTGAYVLSRNLEALDFHDFYQKLPWPLPTPGDLAQLYGDDRWVQVLRPALTRVNEYMEKELRISLASIVAEDGSPTAAPLRSQ
jgi:membrane protein